LVVEEGRRMGTVRRPSHRLVGIGVGLLAAATPSPFSSRDAGGVAFAHGSNGPGQAATPPVFPTGVGQVLVDVVVVDGRGKPVVGLEQSDFALTEDGTPQTLSSFEAMQAARTRSGSEGAAPGSLMVVFDDLGLTPAQGERTRAAVAKLAASTSEGRLSLVTTSGTLQWPPFPGNETATSLAQTIGLLRGRGTGSWASAQMSDVEAYRIHVEHDSDTQNRVEARYRSADADLAQSTGDLVRAYAAAAYQHASTHARRVLSTLERAAQALGGTPGRRMTVLVSPGFFYEAGLPEYERLLASTRKANVTLYFLEATGLGSAAVSGLGLAGATLGPADEARFGQAAVGPTNPSAALDSGRSSSAGSTFVAEETGGFVVRHTNDLAGALARIAADSGSYYVLGYTPTNAANDGKYRRIGVKLKTAAASRKGWAVRARRGYYARAPMDAEASVRAFEALPESGVLPVSATTQPLEDSQDRPGAVRCLLRAAVDLAEVRFREEQGRRRARLVVTFEISAEGAAEPTKLTRDVDLELSRSPTLGSSRRWLPVDQEVELAPGAYLVRTSVREVRSGDRGSAAASLSVPVPGQLRLSERRLSHQVETDDTGRPRAAKESSRAFEAGQTVVLSFDVYGSRPDRQHEPIEVTCHLEHPGGRTVPLDPAQIVADPREGVRAVVRASLKDAAPGEYRVFGSVREKRTSRRVLFWEPFAVTTPSPSKATAVDDPELAVVLKRAGEYVVEYEKTFHDIVAEEEYVQRAPSVNAGVPQQRKTLADLVFVRLPGPIPWATFRDIYQVDGKAVRDRDQRLERLFSRGSASALERAEAILAESARYNIGVERTANLPTLPLLFLHPDNQARFSFARQGEADDSNVVEVAYREVSRPTFIRGRRPDRTPDGTAADLPAHGRFWIDARRGTVVRTEMSLGGTGEAEGTAKISTTYRPEPSLAMWVPEEMKEFYSVGGGSPALRGMPRSQLCNGCYTEAVARYRRMRRFLVTIEENARLPN
jgi:VWFA-related protein